MIRNSAAVTVALATLILGISQAFAQLAPWQQPPGREGAARSGRLNWLPAESGSSSAVAVEGRSSGKVRPASVDVAVDEPAVAAEKSAPIEMHAPAVLGDTLPDVSEFAAELPQGGPHGQPHAPGAGCGCAAGGGPEGGPMPCDDGGECCRGAIFGGPCGLLEAFYDRVLHNHVWFRGEEVIYSTKGGNLPTLLTTSNAAGTGIPGDAGYAVLLGNDPLNAGSHPGGRLELGAWLDCSHDVGIEFTYLGLRPSTDTVSFTNAGTSVLARPFFNVATNAYDSQLLASPTAPIIAGSLVAVSKDEFAAMEALWRRALTHGDWYRIDLLAGFRYQRLDDSLSLTGTITTDGLVSNDLFAARNEFHGAEVGFLTEWRCCRWSMETNLKVALGNTHSRVNIQGHSTQNGQSPAAGTDGGLLALQSNIGEYNNNQFSVVPELSATLAYNLTQRLRLTAGYTFMYWSTVARVGDQIDTNIDPNQGPQFGTAVPPAGLKPAPPQPLRMSDYWAQGVNLGLDYKF